MVEEICSKFSLAFIAYLRDMLNDGVIFFVCPGLRTVHDLN